MQEFINKAMLSLGLRDPEVRGATGYLLRMTQIALPEPEYKQLLAGLRNGQRMVRDLPAPVPETAEAAFEAATACLTEAGLAQRQIHVFIFMLLEHLSARKGASVVASVLSNLPQLSAFEKL